MELEKGTNLPHGDPLDLEEGELREDAATIPTTTTTDAAEMEVEAEHDRPAADNDDAKSSSSSEKRRGKRRSDNGEHGHHAKKRSKKDKSSKKDNDGKRHRTADDDNDDEGTTSHKQQQQQHDGEGAADGEGDRRKRKDEHRSSANHHRDNHHSRHRDHRHHHSRSGGSGSGGGKHDERSSPDDSRPRPSESQERRSRSDRERERSRHSASRERERERERERDGRRDGGGDRESRSSSRSRDDRHRERRVADEGRESRYERDDRRTRYDERDHRGAGAGDRRYERGGGREGEYGRGYERNGSGVGGREGEYRRGYERDGADERRGGGDDRGRARSRDETDRKQEQEQQEKKAKQREEEEYAKMVEEELRRKEKEQSEEEKAQKLIEERRKRRQAILDKYKQDKATTAGSDQPAAAAATTEEGQQPAVVVTSADVATVPAADGAKEKLKSEKQEAQPDVVEEEPKKVVTHFDMFNELPAALIPSDQKLGRPLGAAAATGEDELNLADNWDDEEGYYAFRIGEVINKRYTVNASHGKGVFSTVLIAKDAQNNDVDVAIKVIRNNDTMFRAGVKEKELLEKITAADPKDKKHCIRVLDSFQYRNHLCLVLEPMSMNLREVVKKFGRDVGITMQAVRTYARQLFLALKHLKSLNMLHADLKPDNIVLNANLTVLKLCDFGSASLMEEENAITPYLVSRFYRAPEIMLGLPYDFGIDMWAAGCCLFEMYTGKILYPGRSNNEMLRMQMDAMGPFPRKMLRKSKFWQRHFNTQTFYFQQICIDEVSQQEYVKEVNVVKPVRDLKAELQRAATAEDVGHAGQLADLMLKCLCLDPAKRISPEVALAHPFLKP